MKTRALRWWSRASLDDAESMFGPVWSRWCANWNVSPGRVQVANAFESAPLDALPLAWQLLTGAEASAWLACGAAEPLRAIRSLLFGAADHSSKTGSIPASLHASIADAVAADAWADLRREWARLLAPTSDAVRDAHAGPTAWPAERATDVPPAPKRWRGDWRVRLETAQHPRLSIDLFVAAACAETLLSGRSSSDQDSTAQPVSAASRTPLARVADAMHDVPIRLRVALSGVALDLGTLQSLRIGDVVTLPHRLHEALQVQTALGPRAGTSQPIGFAHLGARHGQRAIELGVAPLAA